MSAQAEPVPFLLRVPGCWDGINCFLSSVEEREKLLLHQRKEQSCFSMGAVGARHGVVIYRGTVITAQHLCAGQGVPGDVHDLKYSKGGNGDNVWDRY